MACLTLAATFAASQAEALREFVDKEERGAITECVSRALKREQEDMLRRPDTALDKEGDVAAALADARKAMPVSGNIGGVLECKQPHDESVRLGSAIQMSPDVLTANAVLLHLACGEFC